MGTALRQALLLPGLAVLLAARAVGGKGLLPGRLLCQAAVDGNGCR